MNAMAIKCVIRIGWIASLTIAFGAYLTVGASAARAADALSLLPDSAEAVVGVDLTSVRDSALYQRMEARFGISQKLRLDEFAAFTGLEVRQDLDRLTVGVWGPSGAEQAYLAVLQGNFHWREQALKAMIARAKPLEHRGVLIYQAQPGDGATAALFAPLSEGVALVGRRDAVLEAIDRHQGVTSTRSASATDLHAEARVAAQRGQLWTVASEAALMSGAAVGLMEDGVPGLMDSVESVSFAANLKAGLDLSVIGRCADQASAMSMSTAAQGLLMMARVNVPTTEPELQQMLSSLQVRAIDSRLELTAAFDEAQLVELLNAAERRGLAEKLP